MYDKELQKDVNSFIKDLHELQDDGYEQECYILLGCASKEYADAPTDVALLSRGDMGNTTPEHFCSLLAATIVHICEGRIVLIKEMLEAICEGCAEGVIKQMKKDTEAKDLMTCKFGN